MTAEKTIGQQIEDFAASLGLAMRCEFVPFSKSRNKAEKSPSLNWRVTMAKNDRDFLTVDYSAGCGHCPAYKASVKDMGNPNSILRTGAIRRECETGKEEQRHAFKAKPILPNLADVVSSLVLDSEAIDYTFEEWADNFGYNTDSRKAEASYRECLETAIKLRQAVGDDNLAKLRELCAEY